MLGLSLALRARGHSVELACPRAPDDRVDALAARARAAGLEPLLELARGRRIGRPRDVRDARRLRALLERRDFDVIHAWHTRDHALAAWAGAAQRRRRALRIVRSYASAEAIRGTPWNRWLFGPATDVLVCVSPGSGRRNARLRNGRPVAGVFGAVDLARFRPAAPDPRVREALGLSTEHRVVGIVARVQRHRRFDLLLHAMARLARDDSRAHLLVLGRGTRRAEIAEQPAVRLGLRERVTFAGYRTRDYVGALRCCDVFTQLVPGSDGTCRALLEAAACAIPAVVTRRGALPEIVVDGRTGLVVDEDAEELAGGWRRLLGDAAERRALGAAARRRAELHFAPERRAEAVEQLYAAGGARAPSPVPC